MQRVIVHGLVQGVNFRSFVVDRATALRLDGWVRNLRDGTVEAVFSGLEADVRAMVDLCHQGPRFAEVTRVETFPANPDDLKLRRGGEKFSRLG